MAELNAEQMLLADDRPVYTVIEIGNRNILCSSSKGGQKEWSKSWVRQMVKDGKATLKVNTLTFTGDIEREF